MKQILDSGLIGTLFKAEKSQPSVVEFSLRVSGRPFSLKFISIPHNLSLIEIITFFSTIF